MKKILKKITPNFILEYYYAFWPFLGALLYKHPSRKLKLIGITGTNGKTTVTHISSHVLQQAGFKVASISSLRFKIGEKEWKNNLKMTMPGRMKLQKFLYQAEKEGCEYAIIEVTSEGIKQKRHLFLKFDTAVFTNLTPEHIESHGSFEDYKKAKGSFFAISHKRSIVNLDDDYSKYFLDFPADEKIGYSLQSQESSLENVTDIVRGYSAKTEGREINFKVDGLDFNLPLMGRFNIYNTLAAVAIGKAQGLSMSKIQESLKNFKGIPGRLELVITKPFNVLVDYAHTPDALKKAYKAIEPIKNQKSKQICVLGAAGGGRDKWKRPELGKIASEHCDYIILTDEDPYSENPSAILKDIEKGFSAGTAYEKIIDRKQAIAKALKKAEDNDVVIITGKGAEPLMVTARGPVEWDDRKIVKTEFNKLNK